MRKKIAILLVIIVFSLLGWMGYSSVQKLDEKKEREVLANSLSSMFESLNVDAEIPEGSTLLMYFNSECEHCQWEIKQLSKNIDEFSGINIAFVSLELTDSAFLFLKKHTLQQFFIETRPENIMSTFKGGVPQIFIYKGDKLQQKFRGEVKIETLLKALK